MTTIKYTKITNLMLRVFVFVELYKSLIMEGKHLSPCYVLFDNFFFFFNIEEKIS